MKKIAQTEKFLTDHATPIAMTAVTLLMVMVVCILYRIEQQNFETRAWVVHSREVEEHAEALLAKMWGAGLSHGAYMMTGDEAVLTRYIDLTRKPVTVVAPGDAAPYAIMEEWQALKWLTSDNSVQQKNLDDLAASLTDLLNYMGSTLDDARNGKIKFGAQAIDFKRRESLMKPVDTKLASIIENENDLLALRQQREKDATVGGNIFICIGLAIFYVMVVLALRFCQKAERRAQGEAGQTTRLLAAIVASSQEAIIGKSLDGSITSWNAGAEKLFGYRAAEIIGQPVRLLLPGDREAEEQHILQELYAGHSVPRFETQRLAKDRALIDVSTILSPIRDERGKVLGISTVMHDIRVSKQVEREKEKYIAALKQSNQELDDFAYIASHDLKEPLRGLTNNAMFLKEDFGAALDQNAGKHIDRITFLCQRMEKLIDSLLYFSRLGRQELAIQTTDLNEVVKDIKVMMETTLQEENAKIVMPEALPTVICDLPRITEVFRNLITNAVKYNKSAEKIVEIGFVPPAAGKGKNEAYVFYVRDNGIGIPKQFHEDIFRIFKRLNEEDESVRGSGVGLTFVKKIVERHHGRIWLESEMGKGTVFYFTVNTGKEVLL